MAAMMTVGNRLVKLRAQGMGHGIGNRIGRMVMMSEHDDVFVLEQAWLR